MDLQKLVDAMSETSRMERGNYHVTLGELIEFVDKLPLLTTVKFSNGSHPSGVDSYRGYYSDLAIEPSNEKINVEKFLVILRGSLGKTFMGYKGGDFIMEENTPLWMANYGDCGEAVVSISENGEGDLILITKDLDD